MNSDREGLITNAAPFGESSTTIPSNTIDQQQRERSILEQSRTLALLIYLFVNWFITANYIALFVTVVLVLLLAFDFWTVKNVTGRLLVGLRWWNEIKDDGTNVWMFESREGRKNNPLDARMFWISMYAYPVIWGFLAFSALISFKFEYLLIHVLAITLNVANVVGYTKCEKDAKKQMNSYITGASNSMFQSAVGNLISNKVSNFFGGGASTTARV
ncbi:Golgi apparatus membrane protein TVP23 A [Clydaea vesicula]|uniref:Golgi apparatus membrane protein TVP23 n=1 Tax=Clydaea vesicula TaxID=447962 RepID=A0AAD5Y0U5_9FUNG|nr:Golgi apparatus membrane protein TVP23 A [Clydaea vesicula]KAJ3387311.1 Golgi apparatus membrane protein TVP23 A [Lobulomyces angularis]